MQKSLGAIRCFRMIGQALMTSILMDFPPSVIGGRISKWALMTHSKNKKSACEDTGKGLLGLGIRDIRRIALQSKIMWMLLEAKHLKTY